MEAKGRYESPEETNPAWSEAQRGPGRQLCGKQDSLPRPLGKMTGTQDPKSQVSCQRSGLKYTLLLWNPGLFTLK